MKKQRTRDSRVMEKFGAQLKSLRQKKGMTQEVLGFKAGISTSQVARIEAGKLNTTISTVISLARAMETDPCVFFENIKIK
jgi:transcriptional regulator with XRE-family HTH domain